MRCIPLLLILAACGTPTDQAQLAGELPPEEANILAAPCTKCSYGTPTPASPEEWTLTIFRRGAPETENPVTVRACLEGPGIGKALVCVGPNKVAANITDYDAPPPTTHVRLGRFDTGAPFCFFEWTSPALAPMGSVEIGCVPYDVIAAARSSTCTCVP